MILPGLTATGGWRGEREPPARTSSKRSFGKSERRERARRPLRLLFPPLPLLFIEEKGRQKTRSGKPFFIVGRGLMISPIQLPSYNQSLFSHHPPIFCTFSLLEEKNCTKRETGKGARKPFVPSDEPEQSSDNVLGNSFLPPSRSPRSRNVPGESSSPIPRFASDH